MTKKDLKVGMIVDVACNYSGIIYNNYIQNGYEDVLLDLDYFRDNLTHINYKHYDIVKIYTSEMELLWERKVK